MNSRKILFATMPMDGHLNPLTGLAVHLQQLGHDVRWYTGPSYADKIQKLGIPCYPFQKALEVNQLNIDQVFPERQTIKGTIARLRFDLNNVFLLRAPEFVRDLIDLHEEFAFDLLVCDVLFTGAPFVKQLFNIPVAAVGVVPLAETSKDLPPSGLGMEPSTGFWGRRKQDFLRFLLTRHLLKPCTDLYNELLVQHGLPKSEEFVFDTFVRQADVYLQSGVPGFEYARTDVSPNVRFVGPLLPYKSGPRKPFVHLARAGHYKNVVLVTQGTVERDPEKIIVPTLEAFKNDPTTLVIATTGGSQTDALRTRFPQPNFIIEDYIDFHAVMPHADVYVTNAGYRGVLLSLQNGLPMVVAGVHEGKNEIAARVGYFRMGINLKTETPTPDQIRKSVTSVLTDKSYRERVAQLGEEFNAYDANARCVQHIHELLRRQPVISQSVAASLGC